MSDPVRISQLLSVNTLNNTDDLVIVQAGNTRRVAVDNLTLQTASDLDDEYLIIRANQLYRLATPDLPVRLPTGQYVFQGGNYAAPTEAFPFFCLTNFEDSTSVSDANYPDYVSWLRAQTAAYRDGFVDQVSSYSGSVTGSVLTLDNNTANNAILAALNEDQLAFGTFSSWRTVDIDGTTFAITALNTTARTITVTGSPSTGTQNATFYPHRIAGSTTTARLISLVGRTPIGAGSGGVISGLLRRDRFQGHYHAFRYQSVGRDGGGGDVADQPQIAGNLAGGAKIFGPTSDGISGAPRTGPDTHGPDFGSHIYQFVGRYVP